MKPGKRHGREAIPFALALGICAVAQASPSVPLAADSSSIKKSVEAHLDRRVRLQLAGLEATTNPATDPPEKLQIEPLPPVPFGLAGIAWGFQHPDQAERLVLPVFPGPR